MNIEPQIDKNKLSIQASYARTTAAFDSLVAPANDPMFSSDAKNMEDIETVAGYLAHAVQHLTQILQRMEQPQ